MEEAINRLKEDGHTSEEINAALLKMKEEVMGQPIIEGSLDDYLDSLDLSEALKQVDLMQKGLLPKKTARDFLKELRNK